MSAKEFKKQTLEKLLIDLKDIDNYKSFRKGAFVYDLGHYQGQLLLQELNKYKEVLDKIKDYCNHKLEMLELQKRNIMQILTPENGYLKADIEIEMQKYKDILELLEEIE